MTRPQNLFFENAQLVPYFKKNFGGTISNLQRGFNIVLDNPEEIERLSNEGWNVSIWKPNDADMEPVTYLPVAIKYNKEYKNLNPTINMIQGNIETPLFDETVGMLDDQKIIGVDAMVRPYYWEVNGKSGIKAYVESADIYVEMNRLDEKRRARRASNAQVPSPAQTIDEDIPF